MKVENGTARRIMEIKAEIAARKLAEKTSSEAKGVKQRAKRKRKARSAPGGSETGRTAIKTMLDRGEWISSRRYLEREFNLTERSARKIAAMDPPAGWVEVKRPSSPVGGRNIKVFMRPEQRQ